MFVWQLKKLLEAVPDNAHIVVWDGQKAQVLSANAGYLREITYGPDGICTAYAVEPTGYILADAAEMTKKGD